MTEIHDEDAPPRSGKTRPLTESPGETLDDLEQAAQATTDVATEAVQTIREPFVLLGGFRSELKAEHDETEKPKKKKRIQSWLTKLGQIEEALRQALSRGNNGSMLPAIAERAQQAEAEAHGYAVALAGAEAEARELTIALGRMETQRDEFDSMLRREESKRQQAETDAQTAKANAARYRLDFLKTKDPRLAAAGSEQDGVYQVRLRVLAWLGNYAAAADLGLPVNTCPMCRAAPQCYVDPRRPNPHGSILPKKHLDYLRDLVDQALIQERDPTAALDAWASGGEIDWDKIPPKQVVKPATPDVSRPAPVTRATMTKSPVTVPNAVQTAPPMPQFTGSGAAPDSAAIKATAETSASTKEKFDPYAKASPDEKGSDPNVGGRAFNPGVGERF
jgi:hypothetical protein